MAGLTVARAEALTGGLSNPSKMPGRAWGLPAAGAACPIGARLAKVPGTVCHGCYATKGMYGFRNVREAQAKRFRGVRRALRDAGYRARWVEAMTLLVGRQTFFRWHDSGDVFSLEYLSLIVDVVRATPGTRHWLPTRELLTVRQWMRANGAFPENLTVRLSLPTVDVSDDAAARVGAVYGLTTSTVRTAGWTCPSSAQGNECRDCRACWDPAVPHVSYRKH